MDKLVSTTTAIGIIVGLVAMLQSRMIGSFIIIATIGYAILYYVSKAVSRAQDNKYVNDATLWVKSKDSYVLRWTGVAGLSIFAYIFPAAALSIALLTGSAAVYMYLMYLRTGKQRLVTEAMLILFVSSIFIFAYHFTAASGVAFTVATAAILWFYIPANQKAKVEAAINTT